MSKTRQLLIEYVDAASNLAEAIQNNIKKDRFIDDATVLLLNDFIIASNRIRDLTDELSRANLRLN